jgi:hypothetical protein
MQKKILFSLAAIAISFSLLVACSDDSGADSAQSAPEKTPTANSTYAKLDSCSFVASEGSCGGERGLMKTVSETDSVHVVMNKDGSAVLKDRFGSICAENGEVSKISLDKREDTLWVHVEYREFPPDVSGGSRCECFADYEIDIPTEFVGAKYMTFNGNYLWNITYEQP